MQRVVRPLSNDVGSGLGADIGLSECAVGEGAGIVDAKLSHLQEEAKGLNAGHARGDSGARADGDYGGEDVVGGERRGRSREHHRSAATGVLDHGDDGAGESLLARTQRQQGIVLVLAVRHQGACPRQRSQVQPLVRESRVDDPHLALLQAARHRLILLDHLRWQSPAVELAHQGVDLRAVAVDDHRTLHVGESVRQPSLEALIDELRVELVHLQHAAGGVCLAGGPSL